MGFMFENVTTTNNNLMLFIIFRYVLYDISENCTK